MITLYEASTYVFDPLHAFWENERTQKFVAGGLAAVFLLALIVIEINRRFALPEPFEELVPYSHFGAVALAFKLVLLIEVMSLIFTLPCSVSKAVGKQLEILALILLRNSFKELVYLPEPISLEGDMAPVFRILADAVGGVVIFALLGVYYRCIKSPQLLRSAMDRYRFVAVKKCIALLLLGAFIATGIYTLYEVLTLGKSADFFVTFYTILIFGDILMVLVAQRFMPSFQAIFRNSGYAVATLLMRLALSAPAFWNTGLGVVAALFALGLTLAYNNFFTAPEE